MRSRNKLKAVNICLILGSTLTVLLMLTLAVSKFVHDFEEEKRLYDMQNVCIAYHIRLGVERSDIYRDGETCRVERWR